MNRLVDVIKDAVSLVERFWRNAVDVRFDYIGKPEDYYATLGGLTATMLFCFFLFGLILQARRGNRADYTLAAVFFVLGCLTGYAAYRITHRLGPTPWVTPGFWIVLSLAEAVASIQIIRELRAKRRERLETEDYG